MTNNLKFSVTALLPMKGHSERVPNKNLKMFSGKPLYHCILGQLLGSKIIDNVVINTDSDLIIHDINNNFPERVKILKRPKEIQGDHVSMNKIIAHDIELVKADIYIQTHSTNPNLRTATIDRALARYIALRENGGNDSVFSVDKVQSRFYTKEGRPLNHDPSQLIRTQDLEPIYEENSNFYIFSEESFYENGSKRIGGRPYMFEVDRLESMDIDDINQFIIAEAIYNSQYSL